MKVQHRPLLGGAGVPSTETLVGTHHGSATSSAVKGLDAPTPASLPPRSCHKRAPWSHGGAGGRGEWAMTKQIGSHLPGLWQPRLSSKPSRRRGVGASESPGRH